MNEGSGNFNFTIFFFNLDDFKLKEEFTLSSVKIVTKNI